MDMKNLNALVRKAFDRYCARREAYPNVAADPSMYWPSVRSMPRGPGPWVMMLYDPKMKPIQRPTADQSISQ
jgi:hypothetical protein